MTEAGFSKAQSDNLPRIDGIMMAEYFSNNTRFFSAEIRSVKAERSSRDFYGDDAVGYVQLKRSGTVCTVKGRITPEHKVRNKPYHITLTCDEEESRILGVSCEDCAASQGGCKHAIAFVSWLHRRSEEPSSTSIKCYWLKPRLSNIGSTEKFIKAKTIGNAKRRSVLDDDNTFMNTVKKTTRDLKVENLFTQSIFECNNLEKISIHQIMCEFKNAFPNENDALKFIHFCSLQMNKNICKMFERATVEQSNEPLWFEMRYGRITASKVYETCHCHTLDGSLVETILGARKFKGNDFTARGKTLEPQVVIEVEKQTGQKFKSCGLMLNDTYLVLGASPDGFNDKYILEIKCPVNVKTMETYFVNENTPAPRHVAQMKTQMFFANLTEGLFCVAYPDFETSRKIKIIKIAYDENCFKDLMLECNNFWAKAIFPKIHGILFALRINKHIIEF